MIGKKGWRNIWEKGGIKGYYIPYIDSDGNELEENEILFTNEKNYQGFHVQEIWEEEKNDRKVYTVSSPGVEPLYDDTGNFPIALISPEGEKMYLKISARTGEILPTHAGCCRSIDVIYAGAPQAGKTVNILQMRC